MNRDRWEPRGSALPTPPYVRVRTRRFGERDAGRDSRPTCKNHANDISTHPVENPDSLMSTGLGWQLPASSSWLISFGKPATARSFLTAIPQEYGMLGDYQYAIYRQTIFWTSVA